MARSKRSRSRRPYHPPEPGRTPGPALTPRADGGPARRDGGSFPLLPVSLGGLGIGLLVIAFLFLNSNKPAPAELVVPAIAYGAENADMSLGSPTAKVTVTMWGDFQCPACATFARQREPQLVSTYVATGKVKLVFRDFAFIGPESLQGAMAARCSGAQGHFWPYHGYLYANQAATENSGTLTTARLDEIARAVGLEMTAFDACLSGGATRPAVQADTAQAQQLGIQSTPTIVVGNQAFSAVPTWDQLSAVIEAALAAAAGG